MADYMTSTHRAKWIFTPQDLKEKYKDAHKRAKEALEKYGSTKMEVDIDGFSTYIEPQHDAKNNSEKHSRPKALEPKQEQIFRAYHEYKIQDVCDAFKFPCEIQATALIYFKRFYSKWSVMSHHPRDIMFTCIYIACKTEENYEPAEEIANWIGQHGRMILKNEMLVLQSLEFDLIVYSPYRGLDGFIFHMEEFYDGKLGQSEIIKNLYESAKLEVHKIMRSDAPLLFPPGQLALAALRRASEFHKVIDFERYLNSRVSRQQSVHNFSDLNVYLDAIDMLINKLETPTMKDVQHIDWKLKSCLDPSSRDKSKKRKHGLSNQILRILQENE